MEDETPWRVAGISSGVSGRESEWSTLNSRITCREWRDVVEGSTKNWVIWIDWSPDKNWVIMGLQ